MIDANIIPPLVFLLGKAEFEIKKEAAWALSNATSGGTPDQIKYLLLAVLSYFHSVQLVASSALQLFKACW